MSQTLMVRFGADTSGAKSAMIDLASSVAQSAVTLGTAVQGQAKHVGGLATAMQSLRQPDLRSAIGDQVKQIEALGSAMTKAGQEGGAAFTQHRANVLAVSKALSELPKGTLAGVLNGDRMAVEALNAALRKLPNNPYATALGQQVEQATALSGTLDKVATVAGVALRAFIGFQVAKLIFDGLTSAARAAAEEVERLTKIGAAARDLGVGTTFLQSWTAQARELKTEAASLQAMLEQARSAATIRLGEGGGTGGSAIGDRLAQHRKAGNVTAADETAYGEADTQEARIRVILDLIDRLMEEGKQLAALDLANRMFGPDFETKMRAGVAMTESLRRALDGITAGPDGRIIPPEEIARAQAIEATLREAERIMADALRPLREDLARIGQQDAMAWADIKLNMANGVSYLMQMYEIAGKIRQTFAEWGNAQIFKDAVAWMDQHGWMDKSPPPGFADPNAPEAKPAPLALRIAPKGDTSKPLPASGRASAPRDEQSALETFINGLERQTVALKAEVDAYDRSNAQKRVAIDLARAEEIAKQNGLTVTDEQTKRISAAAEALQQYRDKIADLDQAQRQSAETARFFGRAVTDSLGSILIDGQKATDVLHDLSRLWSRAALDALGNGSGPLAGLFGTAPKASEGNDAVGGLLGVVKGATKDWNVGEGLSSLFAGFRANGGPVAAGRAYRINERGEEWFVPAVNGRIMPASAGPGAGGLPVQAGAAQARPVMISFAVQSPDAAGFVRSEAQVTGMLARAVQRGMRGV